MEPFKQVIDYETGELVNIYGWITEEDLHSKQIYDERNAKLKALNNKKSKSFTFIKMDKIKSVLDEKILTNVELGYLLLLQTYLDYDNVLVVSTHNKKPMTRKDIGGVLSIKNRGHLKVFLEKLMENELITEKIIYKSGKDQMAFVMNDKYHFKGRTKNKKVIKVFSLGIREIFKSNLSERWNPQPATLGVLYKLLPYVHYETNVICENPYESDENNIKALSIKEICEIVGIDKKNLHSKITNLYWGGMNVIVKVVSGSKVHLKLNPFLFYRQYGEPDVSLKVDFLVR